MCKSALKWRYRESDSQSTTHTHTHTGTQHAIVVLQRDRHAESVCRDLDRQTDIQGGTQTAKHTCDLINKNVEIS